MKRGKSKELHSRAVNAPTPAHFDKAWPTVQTATFVEMVFGSIEKRGLATYDDIVSDTQLKPDVVDNCIAELWLWDKKIVINGEAFERVYYVKGG